MGVTDSDTRLLSMTDNLKPLIFGGLNYLTKTAFHCFRIHWENKGTNKGIDGRMDGRTNEHIDRRMDKRRERWEKLRKRDQRTECFIAWLTACLPACLPDFKELTNSDVMRSKSRVVSLVRVIRVKCEGNFIGWWYWILLWQLAVMSVLLGAAKFSQCAIPGAQRNPVIFTHVEVLQVEYREPYPNSVAFRDSDIPHAV